MSDAPKNFFDAVVNLTKTINNTNLRLERLESDMRDIRQELASLRKEVNLNNVELRDKVAAQGARIAALEEGRKTVAAEVGAALTKTIAQWENDQLRKEIESLRKSLPTKEGKD
jgi:chaperonin cofactor prefoldin